MDSRLDMVGLQEKGSHRGLEDKRRTTGHGPGPYVCEYSWSGAPITPLPFLFPPSLPLMVRRERQGGWEKGDQKGGERQSITKTCMTPPTTLGHAKLIQAT